MIPPSLMLMFFRFTQEEGIRFSRSRPKNDDPYIGLDPCEEDLKAIFVTIP